ncbi:MAG: hypothetical protein CML68_23030 [Rhodobacteraceae bacterium]|nr:hypothetical protein [Paracoccaceae bacterium]
MPHLALPLGLAAFLTLGLVAPRPGLAQSAADLTELQFLAQTDPAAAVQAIEDTLTTLQTTPGSDIGWSST